MATRPVVPRLAVADIAAANALWALSSWSSRRRRVLADHRRHGLIVMQALVVAGIAALQALAMRSGVAAPVRPNASAISS